MSVGIVSRLERSSLYILGRLLEDPETKVLFLDAILYRARKFRLYKTQSLSYHVPHIEANRITYDGNPSDSFARQLIVKLYDS